MIWWRAAILACVLIAPPAAAEKVLRYAFRVAETGFDPVQINDLYSAIILAHIFDPPFTLDYLARPFKVKANTAAGMPEVSADGKLWTIRIRPGIYFADDPMFRGKKRELTAQDYVYSLKRHFDPKNKSPNFYLLDKRVGTNAYPLAQWTRSSRIVLERNPNYREHYYDPEAAPDDPVAQEIAARMRGKRLPQIDRVEVYIIEEAQPRWLAFLNAEHDLIAEMPFEFVNLAAPEGELAPHLQKKKIQLDRTNEFDLTFFYFGMEHPVVGGYTPEKVALRRAIALAVDPQEWIRALYYGQAIVAQSTVPPGAYGFDPEVAGPLAEFNPAKAKALLDVYGYVDRDGDGYREAPDGSKLVLEMASTPDSLGKQLDELWRKYMDRVGIRMEFIKKQWPEHLRASRAGKLMMWRLGWIAGDPDADTFYTILYGPNKGQSNQSRFDLPQWNALYEKAKVLPNSPERDHLYREMDKLFFAYAPMRPISHRIITGLAHPWVVGYRRNPVMREFWKYLDIDESVLPAQHVRAGRVAAAPAQ